MARKNIAPKPIPELTEAEIARFWSRVDKTPGQGPQGECWFWTTAKRGRYGVFAPRRYLLISAHRLAFKLHYGYEPIPETLHICDSPPCVNPSHLRAGTAKDNAIDRCQKGRGHQGDKHWSRLHPEMVLRGDANIARRHPELLARGDRNGARLHPELHPRGERIGTSKLKAEQVIAIRQRYADGETNKSALGREFGVTGALVAHIVTGKAWKHIPMPPRKAIQLLLW